MKTIIGILIAFVVCLGAATANAQTTFAGQGVSQTATNEYYIVPAGDGYAQIQYVNVNSDKAGATLRFFTPSQNSLVLTNTQSIGSSNITFTSNSTLTNGDYVVIRHATGNQWKYNVGAATATNVFLSMPLSNAIVAGDVLTEYSVAGSVLWGALTNSLNAGGAGIFNGPLAKPVVVEIDSTSAGALNVVAGEYKR